MRIDEIKGKFSRMEYYDNVEAHKAIAFLVNRLDIAEKSFEMILDERGQEMPAKHTAPIYREIAIQALQQLRS